MQLTFGPDGTPGCAIAGPKGELHPYALRWSPADAACFGRPAVFFDRLDVDEPGEHRYLVVQWQAGVCGCTCPAYAYRKDRRATCKHGMSLLELSDVQLRLLESIARADWEVAPCASIPPP